MLVKAFIATIGLAAVSSAHMVMVSPVPFDKSTLDNGPLEANGVNFPCKHTYDRPYALEGASNVFEQGSTHQLEFKGSAVHAGGSCQVSVTTDSRPTNTSSWKVIKSFEGGCPARKMAANYPENPNLMSGNKYDYTIPTEMPAGDYVIAWTWFNKVGNREMYMNCAPLTVKGSAGSEGFLNTLPNMMVANLKPFGDCATESNTDIKFPNPGQDVERPNGDAGLVAPKGNCGGGAGKAPAPSGNKPAPTTKPSNGTPGNGTGLPTSSAGGNPAPTQPAGGYPNGGSPNSSSPNGGSPSGGAPKSGAPNGDASSTGYPGGVFMTVSKANPAATGSPSSPAQPNPAAPAPSDKAGPAPAGGFAAGTPCTSEGEWNCVGGSSFQRCASGAWSAMSQMSGGMKCSAGQSANIEMTAGNARRAMRRAFRFAA